MIRYTSSGHPERSEGPRKDVIWFSLGNDNPSFDCEVLRFELDDTRLTIQRFNPSTVQRGQYSSPSSSFGGTTRSPTAYA
jgi:hypothetical protein